MRIFGNVTEAVGEIERDLWELGTRVPSYSVQDRVVDGDDRFSTIEITGYGYKITDHADINQFIEDQHLSKDWLETEFDERTGGVRLNPGRAWMHRKSVWEPFLHQGRFAYTYSDRIGNAFALVIDELRAHPTSRQAVVSIWDSDDLKATGGKSRIPCSIFYQLMVRDGVVDLHYVMRSCDFLTHFKYDLVLSLMIQDWIAKRLNRPSGVFHHYVTSFHAFKKDMPAGIF